VVLLWHLPEGSILFCPSTHLQLAALFQVYHKRVPMVPVISPFISAKNRFEIQLAPLSPPLVGVKPSHKFLDVANVSSSRRLRSTAQHPRSPVFVALALITLAARGHQIGYLGNVSRGPAIQDEGAQMIPFRCLVATISTAKLRRIERQDPERFFD